MYTSKYLVDIFFNDQFGHRKSFWLKILGLASRTLGADFRTVLPIVSSGDVAADWYQLPETPPGKFQEYLNPRGKQQ